MRLLILMNNKIKKTNSKDLNKTDCIPPIIIILIQIEIEIGIRTGTSPAKGNIKNIIRAILD